MYVAVQRRPTDRTLGDGYDFLFKGLNPFSKDFYPYQAAAYYATGTVTPPPPPSANPPAVPVPVDDGTSLFIPGSSFLDILKNAFTGKPTDAQIAVNTNTCIQSIQNMRALAAKNGQPGPPAGAENLCITDQQSYVKLIGGTADQQTSKTMWAWVLLAGVVGAVYVVSR